MSWLKIDDNFPQHPKVVKLPRADRWTWMEVLGYCARYRTGGRFSRNINGVLRYVTAAFLARCVEVGLLDEDEQEFRVHDWEMYNGETVAIRVAAYLKAHPDASANEVYRTVGGHRADILSEVAKQRRTGTNGDTPKAQTGSVAGSKSGSLPSRPLSTRPLPSAGTPRTGFVCPHPACGVRKKTEQRLLEHLADVHGDEAALARIHELEEKPK